MTTWKETSSRLCGAHLSGADAATIRLWSTRAAIAGKLLALAIVLPLALSRAAPAAEHHDGAHGHGHDTWHADFYSGLMRPDTKTSCCNLSDCRPTEIRSTNNNYEVKKDGRWIRVPLDKIVKAVAPDGGAHICAPPTESTSWDPDYVFCIVMPLET